MQSFDLVIRGGTLITACDSFVADVAVADGRCVAIGADLEAGEREIDANGLQVMPGGVDVHTHLDAPLGEFRAIDDFESGTAAAACGGITTICDYAWQQPGQTIADALDAWHARASGRAHVDYGFHVILSEVTPQRLRELPDIVASGCPSFKVFLINEFGIGDRAFLRLLDAARMAGAIVNVHAENGDMLDFMAEQLLASGRSDPRYFADSRPALAEAEATARAIAYAELVGAEIYIVHLSTRGAARRRACGPRTRSNCLGGDPADLSGFDRRTLRGRRRRSREAGGRAAAAHG